MHSRSRPSLARTRDGNSMTRGGGGTGGAKRESRGWEERESRLRCLPSAQCASMRFLSFSRLATVEATQLFGPLLILPFLLTPQEFPFSEINLSPDCAPGWAAFERISQRESYAWGLGKLLIDNRTGKRKHGKMPSFMSITCVLALC